jgi:hypothetical protein
LSNEDAVDQIRNNPTKINEVANNAMPNSTSTRPSLCALILKMLNINKAITILETIFWLSYSNSFACKSRVIPIVGLSKEPVIEIKIELTPCMNCHMERKRQLIEFRNVQNITNN